MSETKIDRTYGLLIARVALIHRTRVSEYLAKHNLYVGQEMLYGAKKEGAKTAELRIDGIQPVLRQQPGEEFLGQILGIISPITFPANVSIKRVPVSAAQSLQSRLCPGRRGV